MALDKFKVVAIINASGEINEEFLSTCDEAREWLKNGKKPSAIVISDDGNKTVTHVTDLTLKTIENRLDNEYFPNI